MELAFNPLVLLNSSSASISTITVLDDAIVLGTTDGRLLMYNKPYEAKARPDHFADISNLVKKKWYSNRPKVKRILVLSNTNILATLCAGTIHFWEAKNLQQRFHWHENVAACVDVDDISCDYDGVDFRLWVAAKTKLYPFHLNAQNGDSVSAPAAMLPEKATCIVSYSSLVAVSSPKHITVFCQEDYGRPPILLHQMEATKQAPAPLVLPWGELLLVPKGKHGIFIAYYNNSCHETRPPMIFARPPTSLCLKFPFIVSIVQDYGADIYDLVTNRRIQAVQQPDLSAIGGDGLEVYACGEAMFRLDGFDRKLRAALTVGNPLNAAETQLNPSHNLVSMIDHAIDLFMNNHHWTDADALGSPRKVSEYEMKRLVAQKNDIINELKGIISLFNKMLQFVTGKSDTVCKDAVERHIFSRINPFVSHLFRQIYVTKDEAFNALCKTAQGIPVQEYGLSSFNGILKEWRKKSTIRKHRMSARAAWHHALLTEQGKHTTSVGVEQSKILFTSPRYNHGPNGHRKGYSRRHTMGNILDLTSNLGNSSLGSSYEHSPIACIDLTTSPIVRSLTELLQGTWKGTKSNQKKTRSVRVEICGNKMVVKSDVQEYCGEIAVDECCKYLDFDVDQEGTSLGIFDVGPLHLNLALAKPSSARPESCVEMAPGVLLFKLRKVLQLGGEDGSCDSEIDKANGSECSSVNGVSTPSTTATTTTTTATTNTAVSSAASTPVHSGKHTEEDDSEDEGLFSGVDDDRKVQWLSEAIEHLQALCTKRAPCDKLDQLVSTTHAISELEAVMCADELLPLFTWVVAESGCAHLASDFNMMRDFMTDECSVGMRGYSHSTLEFAMQNIEMMCHAAESDGREERESSIIEHYVEELTSMPAYSEWHAYAVEHMGVNAKNTIMSPQSHLSPIPKWGKSAALKIAMETAPTPVMYHPLASMSSSNNNNNNKDSNKDSNSSNNNSNSNRSPSSTSPGSTSSTKTSSAPLAIWNSSNALQKCPDCNEEVFFGARTTAMCGACGNIFGSSR